MPKPRREHKKSRNGCLTCRKRRVKCAEDGPPCKNCVLRAIDCHYGTKPSAEQEYSPAPALSDIPRPKVELAVNKAPKISHASVLELELLHFFTMHTWSTLCHTQSPETSGEQQFLQISVPNYAFQHDFSRHVIFALAALHRASLQEDQEERAKGVRIALQYQPWAQSSFALAMQSSLDQLGEPLFAASLGFLVLAVAVPRYLDAHLAQAQESPIETITMAYRLFCGSGTLLRRLGEAEPSTHIVRLFTTKDMTQFPPCSVEINEALANLRRISGKRYHMVEFNSTTKTNTLLIDALESAFRRAQAGIVTAPFGWLMVTPDDLIKDLVDGQLDAALIFCHWCVLLDRSHSLWWVPVTAAAMIEQLMANLQKDPSVTTQHRQAFQWCLNQTQHAPTLSIDG